MATDFSIQPESDYGQDPHEYHTSPTVKLSGRASALACSSCDEAMELANRSMVAYRGIFYEGEKSWRKEGDWLLAAFLSS